MDKLKIPDAELYEIGKAIKVAHGRLTQLDNEDYNIHDLRIKLHSIRMCGDDLARQARALLDQYPEV